MARIEEIPLDLKGLAELDDGKIALLFESLMQRIAMDCANRPDDSGVRKAVLTVLAKPELDSDTRELGRVHVSVQGTAKVPPFVTKSYETRADRRGLRFNRDFPDALDQLPLTEVEDPRD